MKIHKPIAQQVVMALSQIFLEGYKADKVIDRLFRNNRKLGSRDRKFIAESVYDINRWWRLLWSGLDGMPQNFSEGDLWKLFGVLLVWKRQTQERGQELPNWPELKDLDPHEVLLKIKASSSNPAIRNSVPDWLYDLGKMEFGELKWISILESLNNQAPVVIRTNRLKVTRDELQRKLYEEGVETSPAPQTIDGLILSERKNVFTSQSFKSGFFEVQDGASQQVAPLLDAQPGDRAIDACAGAGGKSLHLAAIMKNKGKIIAMDIHQRKLDELKKRSARAGCDIIETRLIDSSKTIKRLKDSADRLLLDVPCSGLGVLRRNPDSKWKLNLEEISRLKQIQSEILSDYSEMVKVGGRMVYATCSILPSENEKQVANFLATQKGKWRLIEERQFHPGENGYDGFYAAALERIN